MSEITYENIQPLIQKAEPEGHSMKCVFKCPVTDTAVEASAAVTVAQTAGKRAAAAAKRGLWQSLRNAVSRSIRSALGGGVAGRVAGSAAQGAMSGSTVTAAKASEKDRQNAVVNAFRSVANQFFWDAKNGRWVSNQAAGDLLTEFVRQLGSAGVAQRYDKGILARMLAEVANADGKISEEERGFLGEFIPADVGTVDQLLSKPVLTKTELGEVSKGEVRRSMVMIAWALALTDEDLADEETKKLAGFANGLGIPAGDSGTLKSHAQLFVVDQGLESAYPGGVRDEGGYAKVKELAAKIGVEDEAFERADVRFRKRNGIV